MTEDLTCIICGSYMNTFPTNEKDMTYYNCPECGLDCYKRDPGAVADDYEKAMIRRAHLNEWKKIFSRQ